MRTPIPPDGFNTRKLTSFELAGTLVGEFEAALKDCGIKIDAGSDLEFVCLQVLDLEYRRLNKVNGDPLEDVRLIWRRSGSLIEIMQLFLRAYRDGRSKVFLPHLDLLNKGFAAQNISIFPDRIAPKVFDASNKLFELFFGLVCSPIASEITMDDPFAAKGDNPDVLAKIDGVDWGFACKVISGTSLLTMYENLEKAINQVETSSATTGVAVLKLTNAVDHDAVWPILNEDEYREGAEPIFAERPNLEPVLRHLADVHAMKHKDLEHLNGRPAIEAAVRGKKAVPGALTFLQTTTAIATARGPMVSTVGQLGIMKFDTVSQNAMDLFNRLNDILHSRV